MKRETLLATLHLAHLPCGDKTCKIHDKQGIIDSNIALEIMKYKD